MDILAAMRQTPAEIGADMWQRRFDLKVGMVDMVMREFTVELHRLTETEFLFVFSNVPVKDKHAILDKIYGRA